MSRRILSVRWVTITLLAIAIIIVFLLFGRWQLHRWESRGTSVVPLDSRPPVELSTVVTPDEPLPGGAIGRQAIARGSFDPAHQVLVPRALNGRPGFWVVTPLQPAGGGAAELVVRGWVPSATDPAARAATGPVTVAGRLYASEDPPPLGTGGRPVLPPGQFAEVNTAQLTGAFPYRILDGFLLLTSQTPTIAPAPAVVPQPVRLVNHGGGLRNLAYAIQWCLFAFAVLFFWVKLIRDDLAADRGELRTPEIPDRAAPVQRRREGAAVPDARADDDRSPVPTGPVTSADDPEDAELAAYNRYLAQLHERSSRSTRS